MGEPTLTEDTIDEYVGKRIKLIEMPQDMAPIEPGSTGRIRAVRKGSLCRLSFFRVVVDWDNRRSLMMIVPPDRFEILPD